VISGPAAPSASNDPYQAACLSFESISSSCDTKIPGFAAEAISAEENCLCFTSGTYAPSIFDGYWASCLNYYSPASPAIYSSSLRGDAGVRSPCALFVPTNTGGCVDANAPGQRSDYHDGKFWRWCDECGTYVDKYSADDCCGNDNGGGVGE
jgi:hypothetical protein